MSDDFAKEGIEEIYNRILPRVRFGSMFGKTIDMTNPKEVAVAFYMIAKKEAMEEHKNTQDHLFEILGKPKNMLGL